MKVTLTWGQLAEVEALIDALRAAQSYGSGEIRRESGATVVWDNDQVTVEIPDNEIGD
jgi:hypothetical protein